MTRTSDTIAALALSVSAALVACAASASPVQRVQHEVYRDQQAAPRDQQTVSNPQTPAELQSHGAQQPSSSTEPKSEQRAQPPSGAEQPNAFVSGKSNEPQDVAETEPQSREQSNAEGQQEQNPWSRRTANRPLPPRRPNPARTTILTARSALRPALS